MSESAGVMHKGLGENHILNASSNPCRMLRGLESVLGRGSLRKIEMAINQNVKMLYELGLEHYNFALRIRKREWRQRISRLYYAGYNTRRAVMLAYKGSFSTDSSDHKNVHDLPDALPGSDVYKIQLANLREDRNLADYNHQASVSDLVVRVDDAEKIVTDFMRDARIYLKENGVKL